ncbi:unnamed protein product [Closterium sp. NIES-54]
MRLRLTTLRTPPETAVTSTVPSAPGSPTTTPAAPPAPVPSAPTPAAPPALAAPVPPVGAPPEPAAPAATTPGGPPTALEAPPAAPAPAAPPVAPAAPLEAPAPAAPPAAPAAAAPPAAPVAPPAPAAPGARRQRLAYHSRSCCEERGSRRNGTPGEPRDTAPAGSAPPDAKMGSSRIYHGRTSDVHDHANAALSNPILLWGCQKLERLVDALRTTEGPQEVGGELTTSV